jgi:hypothetical protein
MNRMREVVLALAAAAVLLASAGPAAADDAAAAAAAAARAEHGGRVLKVERKGDEYRVKILKDSGRLKIVRVPVAKKRVPGKAESPPRKRPDESVRKRK